MRFDMNQAICIAIGRVFRDPRIVTPTVGKPFVNLVVKLNDRHFNGKVYSQRIDVRLYGNALEDIRSRFKPGQLVSVNGEADAFHSEIHGRHYANIRVTGHATTATVIDEPPCAGAKPN